MTADSPTTERSDVRLSVSDPALVAPALERLVSAAAVQAALPVDRLMNALAAVDALVDATGRVFAAGEPRNFEIEVGERELKLTVDGLVAGRAEALIAAAALPEVGNVLDRVADSISNGRDGDATKLTIVLK